MPPMLKLSTGKNIQLFRFGVSTIAIIYRVAVITSIVTLIQEDKFKLALPIIITQLFMIGSSIFGIINNR